VKWSGTEVDEVRVELRSPLPNKAERLSQRLGRAKADVKEKIREIEILERIKSLALRVKR